MQIDFKIPSPGSNNIYQFFDRLYSKSKSRKDIETMASSYDIMWKEQHQMYTEEQKKQKNDDKDNKKMDDEIEME